jgi:hypothetical protein
VKNAHDRPKDSLTLVCAVLVAQHQAITDLISRVAELERDVAKLREPW